MILIIKLSLKNLSHHVVLHLRQNNLLVFTAPLQKYSVDNSPTLSDLNDELIIPFVDNAAETLATPCLQNLKLLYKMLHKVHLTTIFLGRYLALFKN